MLESKIVIARPDPFYGFSYFFDAQLIDNKFASKLVNKIGVAIKRYSSNKWTPFLVLSKIVAIQAKIHLLSRL